VHDPDYWKNRRAEEEKKRIQSLFTSQRQVRKGKIQTSNNSRSTVSVKLNAGLWTIVKVEGALSQRQYSEIVEEALVDKLARSLHSHVKEMIQSFQRTRKTQNRNSGQL
jgi:hypothetical protein